MSLSETANDLVDTFSEFMRRARVYTNDIASSTTDKISARTCSIGRGIPGMLGQACSTLLCPDAGVSCVDVYNVGYNRVAREAVLFPFPCPLIVRLAGFSFSRLFPALLSPPFQVLPPYPCTFLPSYLPLSCLPVLPSGLPIALLPGPLLLIPPPSFPPSYRPFSRSSPPPPPHPRSPLDASRWAARSSVAPARVVVSREERRGGGGSVCFSPPPHSFPRHLVVARVSRSFSPPRGTSSKLRHIGRQGEHEVPMSRPRVHTSGMPKSGTHPASRVSSLAKARRKRGSFARRNARNGGNAALRLQSILRYKAGMAMCPRRRWRDRRGGRHRLTPAGGRIIAGNLAITRCKGGRRINESSGILFEKPFGRGFSRTVLPFPPTPPDSNPCPSPFLIIPPSSVQPPSPLIPPILLLSSSPHPPPNHSDQPPLIIPPSHLAHPLPPNPPLDSPPPPQSFPRHPPPSPPLPQPPTSHHPLPPPHLHPQSRNSPEIPF
ncbi:hypothetical protein C7M84_018990 [Penaeus vannamei]|uniref:Uncharacterized protein n=1 Tax=Penaeus vannamei TaxID=6689 RepID=A0A3R7PY44_PENVA|nr:hypothetical protein C7M84_018990 [Penaeus vannamei]